MLSAALAFSPLLFPWSIEPPPCDDSVRARLMFNLDPERYIIARTDLSSAVNVWLRPQSNARE